ncbi:MAG: DUF3488 domain-containing protein, partial [bacterium]|nr:DUF3488 domain-containing protein [bacterium]
MNINTQHQSLIVTIRYALIILTLCFLPHFLLAPWWLFLLLLTVVGYRLIADYYGYPILNKGIRLFLVLCLIVILKIHYGSILSNGFFVGFLLTFISLKIIEIHNTRDLKVIVFCNFYLIFSALILIQELWILIYLIITILANFSLMLRLNAPYASLKLIGGKSIKHLLIAIPLSVVLFYLFPRIDPLWQVPSQTNSQTGFSEEMNPGSIEELFKNDSIAMQITFNRPLLKHSYWRGLVLGYYNGRSWNRSWKDQDNLYRLPLLNGTGDYEVMLEPHQKKWLFYSGTPIAGKPNLLFSPSSGLTSQEYPTINQRFSYLLKIQSGPNPVSLSEGEVSRNTQLPPNLNTKLISWAKNQYALVHQNPN